MQQRTEKDQLRCINIAQSEYQNRIEQGRRGKAPIKRTPASNAYRMIASLETFLKKHETREDFLISNKEEELKIRNKLDAVYDMLHRIMRWTPAKQDC